LSEHQEAVTGVGPDGVPRSESGIALGAQGIALSALRPMGTCRIDGKVIECTAEDEVIEPDTPVVVSRVDGWRVLVREAENRN
jgi:membrane-bound serine protease (ClpP class)